jgi:S-ribosylhomocysteine lyase
MHSLKEAKEIAKKVLERGIGVMKNDELKLSKKLLKGL